MTTLGKTSNMSKIICRKHGMILEKFVEKNHYRLTFKLKNERIILRNIINYNLYNLLAKLNKELIENIRIINNDTNEEQENINEKICNILIILKQVGADFGIKPKYIYTETKMIEYEDRIQFISNNTECPKNVFSSNIHDLVTDGSSIMNIFFLNNNEANIVYDFSMVTDDKLPIYMEDMMGLLMKKVFFSLKTFIENI